ncbi:MAG: antibiotic biosynthesis monooxygenase [Bacteroidota bacterium]
MYCILWNYEVDSGNAAAFEQECGRNGSWFKFYESCDDYLGHDLLKNTSGGSYTIIERWITKDAYDSFLGGNKGGYDELKGKIAGLQKSETQVGTFDLIQ